MADESKKVLTLKDEGAPAVPEKDKAEPLAVTIKRTAILGFATVGMFSLFFGGGLAATMLMAEPPAEVIRGGAVLVLPVSPQSPGYDGAAIGLTELVHGALSGVPGLDLVPLSKTAALLGDDRQMSELAGEFKVRYVVQTMVKSNDGKTRFDVSLNLFDGDKGGAVFAEQFARADSEFYGAVDEGLRKIVHGTELELTEGATITRPTESPVDWAKALNAAYICLNAEDGDAQKETMVGASAVLAGSAKWGRAKASEAACHVRLGEKGHVDKATATASAKTAATAAMALDSSLVSDPEFKAMAEAVGALGGTPAAE